jgi:hypothetical protein
VAIFGTIRGGLGCRFKTASPTRGARSASSSWRIAQQRPHIAAI